MTPCWCCPWCGMRIDVGRVVQLTQHAQRDCDRRPEVRTDDDD